MTYFLVNKVIHRCSEDLAKISLSLALIKKVANNLQTKLFEILSLNPKTLDWIIILKNWFSDVDL